MFFESQLKEEDEMGNFLCNQKRKQLPALNRSLDNPSRGRSAISAAQGFSLGGPGTRSTTGQNINNNKVSKLQRKQSAKHKYGFIPDHFSTLD